MATHRKSTAVVNVIGTLFYLSLILQWVWTLIILAHPLISGDMSFLYPPAIEHPEPVTPTPPSPFMIGIVIFVTIAVFAMTVYALIKLPRAIGAHGAATTKQLASSLAPVVTPRTATHAQRRIISYRLTLIIKLTVAVLPLILLPFASPIVGLEDRVIWTIACFCAAWTICYFVLQFALVKLWRVPREQVW